MASGHLQGSNDPMSSSKGCRQQHEGMDIEESFTGCGDSAGFNGQSRNTTPKQKPLLQPAKLILPGTPSASLSSSVTMEAASPATGGERQIPVQGAHSFPNQQPMGYHNEKPTSHVPMDVDGAEQHSKDGQKGTTYSPTDEGGDSWDTSHFSKSKIQDYKPVTTQPISQSDDTVISQTGVKAPLAKSEIVSLHGGSQFRMVIKPGWQKFEIAMAEIRDYSKSLQPLEMQFVLSRFPLALQKVVDQEFEKNIIVRVIQERVVLLTTSGSLGYKNEAIPKVAAILERLTQDIDTKEIELPKSCIIESAKEVISKCMESCRDRISVYEVAQRYFVVGRAADMLDCYNLRVKAEIEKQIQHQKKVELSRHMIDCYDKLCLREVLRKKYPTLQIDEQGGTEGILNLVLKGHLDAVSEGKTFLQKMLKRHSFPLDRDRISLLQYQETVDFIREKIKGEGFMSVLWCVSASEVNVIGIESESELKTFKKIFEDYIGVKELSFTSPEVNVLSRKDFIDICDENEGKVLKIISGNVGYTVTAIKPVMRQILQVFSKQKQDSQAEINTSFAQIQLHGAEPEILKCLQFEALLRRAFPNVSFLINETGWVQWYGHNNIDEWAKLNSFLCDFLTRAFKFRGEIGYDCSLDLLQKKEAHGYVSDRLKSQGIFCFFHQVSECKIELFALNSDDLKSAGFSIKSSIQYERFCKGDTTPNLQDLEKNKEFQRMKKKFQNKFEFFNFDDEIHILATADAAAAFRPLLYHKPKSVRREEILQVSKGKMDWISLHKAKELEKIQQAYDIDITVEDLNGIVFEYEDPTQVSSINSAREAVRSLVGKVSEEYVALDSDLSTQKRERLIEKCSKQNNCVVVEEQPPCKNPMLKKCWLALPYKLESLRINYVNGSATRVAAEMLMCPVNEKMVPIGDCDVISRKGSVEIQKVLQNLQNNSAGYKDFHVEIQNETGDLPFHVIGYTILPETDHMLTKRSYLRSALDSAFKAAVSMNVKSIAVPLHIFPSCPLTEQANLIATFISEKNHGCLQEVYICNNEETGADGIEQVLENNFQGSKYQLLDFSKIHESAGVNDIERDNADSSIKVTLGVGGYLRQEVDALVNTTGRDLDFSKGLISKMILQRAGASVQEDCKRQKRDGIGFGDIIVTHPGSLTQCKNIIHGALPNWIPLGNFSLRVLKLFVYKCLEAADANKCSSLAFPSLGTGKLKYPWRLVAQEMINAIHIYGKRNENTCIQHVKFVIYEKDTESRENFTAEISSRCYEEKKKVDDVIPQMYMESWVPVGNDTVRMQILPKEPRQSWGCNMRVRISVSKIAEGDNVDGPNWCDKEYCYNLKITLRSFTEDNFKSAVKKSLKMAADSRITTMTYLLEGHYLSLNKQSMSIKQAVFEYETSTNHYLYVHIVRLIFPTPEDLQMLMLSSEEKREKQLSDFFKDKLKTVTLFFSKDAPPWRIIRCIEGTRGIHPFLKIYGMQEDVLQLKSDIEEKLLQARSVQSSGVQQIRDYEQWYTAPFEDPSQLSPLPGPTCKAISAKLHKGRKGAEIPHTNKEDYLIIDFENMTLHFSSDSSVKLLLVHEAQCQEAEDGASYKVKVFSELKGDLNDSLTEILDENEEIKSAIKQKCSVTLQKEQEGKPYVLGAESYEHFLAGEKKLQETYSKLQNKSNKENYDVKAKAKSEAKMEVENEESYSNIETIEMSKTDYAVLCFFAERHQEYNEWWKTCANKIEWNGGSLMFTNKECAKDKVLGIHQYCQGLQQESFPLKDGESLTDKDIHDIQSQFEDLYMELSSVKNLVMWSSGYESIQKAKHKIGLKLGRIKDTGRRNRQFGTPSQPSPKLEIDNSSTPQALLPSNSLPSPTLGPGDFKTREGLVVKVYTGNILRLDVDCIVNAANENLMHGGGVAAVISDNAGYDFGRASREYIQLHGPLKVGESCTTTAGDLKYKCVVHTVGPRWSTSKKEQCLQELVTAVAGAIECADTKGMRTIAIPSISAGIFGMPKELCAMQYVEGVKQFSTASWKPGTSSIQEVHFIDRDDSLVAIVREHFRKLLLTPSDDRAAMKTSRQKRSFSNIKSQVEDKPSTESYSKGSESGKHEFQPSKQLKVFLQVSDIVNLSVDVITCPQDRKCEGKGAIAKAIYQKGSDYYRKNNTFTTPLNAGEVGVKVSKTPWRYVFHIVSPRNARSTRNTENKFEEELQDCCYNLVKEADDCNARSIAIPVLGIGVGGALEVAETFTIAAMSAILKYIKDKFTNPEEIYLVSNEEAVIDKMLLILSGEKKMGYKGKDTILDTAATSTKTGDDFQKAAGMTMIGKNFENEDCCICMDKCTEPKRLRCGHVFCKECIDQQFKYKPACPQCGKVFGKVLGNQPPGTIRIKTWKRELEGFEGFGSIEVEYSIPSGKQSDNHPSPGMEYEGIRRSGHLPNTEKGRLVCKLFNVAFTRKLIFTIGRSRTTGKDGVVTWNDIHHKTRKEGGPQRFGYPDPTYLDRVLEELEVKGVTEESADDPSEYREYTDALRYY